ncbi:MAG TPA: S8 family serine peptidase [Opitutales bacterium]|nr:S8 family serine peptidase [Opitutales bacterium]
MPKRNWIIFAVLLLGAAGGSLWFLAQEAELPEPQEVASQKVIRQPLPESERERSFVSERKVFEREPISWPEGAVRNELIFSFKTRGDLESFLREARQSGFSDIEVIPALNLVRIRVSDDQARQVADLTGNAGVSFNPVVAAPEIPPMDGVAANYLPFGDQALPWIGVPDDNSDWGQGVRIAILDTGVADHPSLENASITRMSLLEGSGEDDLGTHGMAVASLLVGQGEIRGIAPAAELLSIQVLDGEGVGDGFQLAKGIIAAVDGGADIINLSLGTHSDIPFLWEAVQYAQQRDVTLVAAGGNDGGGRLMYPAAYSGVVAVGSIDGNGQQVSFSNRGDGLSVMAPGYGLFVAGPDGSMVPMNGTSFSGPIVAGTLAYLQQTLRPGEAVRVLQENANDAGRPGADGIYGHGIIDIERVNWRDLPGVYDIAVADHIVDLSGDVPQVLVTVENRGTAPTANILLEVEIGDQIQRFPIANLGAGEVGARSIPLVGRLSDKSELEIFSRVRVPGVDDLRPDNDAKWGQIRFRSPEEDE